MKTRTTCRVCEGELSPVLTLGEHCVSDFPKPGERDAIRAPLELVICQRCRLLQLKHTVPAEVLYRNYWYKSGTNQSMRDALADISHKAERFAHLKPGDTVLDIGCNDGTLLSTYKTGGLYKVGFDPAQNLAPISSKVSSKTVPTFFNADAWKKDPDLKGRRPKVVTSIAMFYDLEEPRKFVADVKEIMDSDGLWVIQMAYLPLMLKLNAFDNVCHEHLEYYGMASLAYLLRLHDFEIVGVELNDVNGGSYRVYIRNAGARRDAFADDTYRDMAQENVQSLQEQELKAGIEDLSTYAQFALWVERIKSDLVGFIRSQTGQGKRVHVYGASTKGNTLLQYFGLDHTLIEAAAERNQDKWGRVTVGTRIPILSEDESRSKKPDYYLVLPWHFLEEFKRREMAYLTSGGRFLVPCPHFSII